MSSSKLPADVKNALINVCGRSFWYKQPLFDIFDRAGISEDFYLRYEHESKYKIARNLIHDLEMMGEDGYHFQKRLLTELCKLRKLIDTEVPDKDAGLEALRELKRLAYQNDLVVKEDLEHASRRIVDAEARVQQARERERRLKELHNAFIQMQSSSDPQDRGYSLEDLLKELFSLYEINYRKSYRTAGEQIDGFFTFGGFDYLVEARWRKEMPTLNDLSAFKLKVDRKIESTRGLFVSVAGFKNEIIDHLHKGGSANLILMDGYDLTLV